MTTLAKDAAIAGLADTSVTWVMEPVPRELYEHRTLARAHLSPDLGDPARYADPAFLVVRPSSVASGAESALRGGGVAE